MPAAYNERYDGLQLKIESKKLKSGKHQVKFRTCGLLKEEFYGYALVEGDRTLTEIVREIKSKLFRIGKIDDFYQQNLFSIQRSLPVRQNLVIFKA
jgi:hypothetical protein